MGENENIDPEEHKDKVISMIEMAGPGVTYIDIRNPSYCYSLTRLSSSPRWEVTIEDRNENTCHFYLRVEDPPVTVIEEKDTNPGEYAKLALRIIKEIGLDYMEVWDDGHHYTISLLEKKYSVKVGDEHKDTIEFKLKIDNQSN
jgi:hypothetical protein